MRAVPLLIVLLAACYLPASQAQKLYRCGNQYQDRACDSGPGKQISGAANGAPTQAPPLTAMNCTQRGEAAEAIAKRRASGATSEQLLQEIDQKNASAESKLQEKRFVVDVGQLRGSPAEIRVLAESDCVAKSKAAVEVPAGAAPQAQAPGSAVVNDPAAIAAEDAEKKAATCRSYQEKLDDIESLQRGGGNIARMEGLANRRRLVVVAMHRDGCV